MNNSRESVRVEGNTTRGDLYNKIRSIFVPFLYSHDIISSALQFEPVKWKTNNNKLIKNIMYIVKENGKWRPRRKSTSWTKDKELHGWLPRSASQPKLFWDTHTQERKKETLFCGHVSWATVCNQHWVLTQHIVEYQTMNNGHWTTSNRRIYSIILSHCLRRAKAKNQHFVWSCEQEWWV